ncbi:MAG: glycoside hydrolase family 31 protein [Flavobacteriaceae bacterium]|nr:glycoside hydrolase family 31 protein [Flavobacteriaceae bacterium]
MRIVYLAFLLLVGLVSAQKQQRNYISHSLTDSKLYVHVNDGKYIFQFYNDEILETAFIPTGEEFSNHSHAVVMQPEEIDTEFNENENSLQFGTEDLTLEIIFKPFQINYYQKGIRLISEKRGYFKSVHEPMEMVQGNIIADTTHKIEFNLTTDEVLYGAGARALPMNRRGYRLPLYNRAHYGYETHSELMNYTMPVVVSSKKYLLHFDNAPVGYLDFDSNKDNSLTYETISGRMVYQIVVGDDWDDITENYTELTGRQPMLPRWALGNFASRFGYKSQKETVETIQKFRDENMPVDAVILDLYWFGKEVQGPMGNLKFEKDSFPNPHKMINDLKRNQVETILITEPFILTTSNRWKEAVDKKVLALDSAGKPYTYDFFFGNTGLVDLYSKHGFDWFKGIYKDLLQMGVTGMWGDLGEPEVHPSDLIHATGTAQEVHNIYGHDWARLVQKAYHDAKPDLRPFILMRAAYSGSQRYGIVPWTGDVNRTWGGLNRQVSISLQMGLQGIGYMHSDLGGFAGANLDDELYVRWLQYGVFQPIFRPHAQEEVPSEPIFRSEKAKDLSRKAIDLRYQLLPYNYTLMFENSKEGEPLMRPLFFEEADNPELFTYEDAYLWGDDFLISPVLNAGQTSQEVYFPKKSNWIDFYTGQIYQGGSRVNVSLHEDYIPTFVRSGSIIPMAEKMQSTKEYDGNSLIFHYYFDPNEEDAEVELYNDDGITRNAFQNGAYELLEIDVKAEKKNVLEIELEAKTGKNFKTNTKKIAFYIHNLNRIPKKVKFGNREFPVRWNSKAKSLKLEFNWNTAKDKEIQIYF